MATARIALMRCSGPVTAQCKDRLEQSKGGQGEQELDHAEHNPSDCTSSPDEGGASPSRSTLFLHTHSVHARALLAEPCASERGERTPGSLSADSTLLVSWFPDAEELMRPWPSSVLEEDRQQTQHQRHQQQSDQDQPGLWVAKIQSPPQAEALFDKQRRIVGIVIE